MAKWLPFRRGVRTRASSEAQISDDTVALLRKSEAMLAEAQATANLGSWEWDVTTNTVQWSRELCRIYGVCQDREQLTYTDFLNFVHPNDRDRINNIITDAYKNAATFDFEHRIVRRDGTERVLHGRGRVHTDAKGAIVRMAGTAQDITDRKQVEQQLVQSLQEKEVLLREVHHRVKNNFQVVSSLINMQLRGEPDERVRTAFRDCRDRIHAMALVHQKLFQTDDHAHIQMAPYIHTLANDVVRSIGALDGRITLHIDAAPLAFPLDQAIPCALLLNELITNAVKHAFPDGRAGTLRVELQAPTTKRLLLTVADDGVGLPPDIDVFGSSSVGLQLVRSLVAQLEATLSIEREGGTTFRITFDVVADG